MQRAILEAIASLPKDATLKEIQTSINGSYPLGAKKNFPYKVWLEEKNNFLAFYRGEGIARKKTTISSDDGGGQINLLTDF
jgi:hypothetical protein